VQHLWLHNAPDNTPLCTTYISAIYKVYKKYVTATNITSTLRSSITAIDPVLGFGPANISAGSLQDAGMLALLCANVNPQHHPIGQSSPGELKNFPTFCLLPTARTIPIKVMARPSSKLNNSNIGSQVSASRQQELFGN
jgi:hypothetical protein